MDHHTTPCVLHDNDVIKHFDKPEYPSSVFTCLLCPLALECLFTVWNLIMFGEVIAKQP